MFRKIKQFNTTKYISPTEEQDKIAKLKMEREIMEEENRNLSQSLTKKRQQDNLSYNSCKKIEDEHFIKIEKLQNKYLDLVDKVEDKRKELDTENKVISSYVETENYLKGIIPTLEKIKVKLDNEIEKTALKFNADKSFRDNLLSKLLIELEDKKKEFNLFNDKLSETKVEYDKLIEATHLENKVLSIRKKDLEIYELRLRKQYPDNQIIL